MTSLVERRCKPCEGGVQPLSAESARELMGALHGDWQIVDEGARISRTFRFPAYSWTIAFTNAVAWIATTEGHHPSMIVDYSACTVSFTTNAIGGLSDNDFICAAKVDRIAADA